MPLIPDSKANKRAPGLGVVFDKLRQGCVENDALLAMATARAEAENQYGQRLLEIRQHHAPRGKMGFDYDEGATVRKAFEGIVTEMGEEGKHHIQVSENIRVLVLSPFKKWAESHKGRVDFSADFLKSKHKIYEREGNEVQKIQRKYFNKCRLLDEARETDAEEATEATRKLSLQQTQDQDQDQDGEAQPKTSETGTETTHDTAEAMSDEDDEPMELADSVFSAQQIKMLLRKMLTEIPQKELKVPIMGTYEHVSVGSEIVAWLQSNVTSGSMTVAEEFGQDLVNNGLLRLVGQVGSKFANSSVLNYQWKKLAFHKAGLEEKSVQKTNNFSPFVGEYLSGTLNSYLNNPHPDETPIQRLTREVNELDTKYRDAVVKMDNARCTLEEAIYEHLAFMERCEMDRLNAVKHVFLDFLASLSNVVPSIQASVDKYLLFQETVIPERDLLYLVENYKTGGFVPRVTVYDNYYSPAEGWTFGVDLELRCRGDGKRLPQIMSSTLRHLDNEYPVMENDEVRLAVWTGEVSLKDVHALRREVNDGKPVEEKTLQKYPAGVVAGVLKLYLRELPDSVVPSKFYDTIKLIYSEHGNDEDPSTRIRQIQATFGQMRLSQIAVLDALTKHLARLMEIANPGQEYRDKLALELAPCILQSRHQSSLTLNDRHPQRLVHDLIEHRKAIISELKRHTSTGSSRASSMRSISTSSVSSVRPLSHASTTLGMDSDIYSRQPVQRGPVPRTLDPGSMKVRGPRAETSLNSNNSVANAVKNWNEGAVESAAPAPEREGLSTAPYSRKGVELTDGRPMSESPSPPPGDAGSDEFVDAVAASIPPSSPSGAARHGEVLTSSPLSTRKTGSKTDETDSDDEPAITHVQATPTMK